MARLTLSRNRLALPREYEGTIYDLAHIVELLRVVTDMGGPLRKETASALNFLAYLAANHVGTLCTAMDGAPHVD